MQHLNFHQSQGQQLRVASKQMLKSLAQSALKNIPGAEKAIREHFPEGNVKDPHQLFPPKPKNLAYHLGW